jgi:hypothetical protein
VTLRLLAYLLRALFAYALICVVLWEWMAGGSRR